MTLGRLASSLALFLLAAAPARAQQRQGGPGQFQGELRDNKGPLMRVIMNAPTRPAAPRTLALLLVHHGMNGNEGNYFGGTLESLKRLKLDQEFVVISGKSQGPGWVLETDGPITLRMIDWVLATYPVDPRQVYIWGSSNGAGFVGRFGWANQDRIAACVGYCGGYNFQKPAALDPAAEKQEWYFVHGGNDNPQNSGNACKQLKEMGYRYVFRQLDGYGHTDIWDGAGHPDLSVVNDVRDDYMLWLRGIRHKTMDPEKRDKEWLAKFENKGSAESLFGSKATFLNLARIGGAQAGSIVAEGLRSKAGRGNAADACSAASFGKPAADELARLVFDESDRVSQAAIRALGVYANWHYPEAIDALSKVALGQKDSSEKGPSVGERLLALDGLARAARLAVLGNFEDKRMWWTFVQLLEDDEVKIRAAAFAALQKASKDGFGYQPGATADQRRPAVARAQAWCTQKCGAPER
jgi:hypothetical protein